MVLIVAGMTATELHAASFQGLIYSKMSGLGCLEAVFRHDVFEWTISNRCRVPDPGYAMLWAPASQLRFSTGVKAQG